MPVLTIFAGPNGSGKSTITNKAAFEGCDHLLDPDAIARRMNAAEPAAAAIAAGREVLARLEEYLQAGVSFALETTLSSVRNVDLILRAQSFGFRVHLVYIALDSADRNITRVLNRVRRGGHSVPEADIRRRYRRSMENAPKATRLADSATVYDNSEGQARLILTLESGRIVWRADHLPEWSLPLLTPDKTY